MPDPCLLYPERIVEYPDPFETIPVPLYELLWDSHVVAIALEYSRQLVTKPWSPLDDASSLYQCALSTADGTKVGGYPDWVQDPWYPKCACGATMDHLVSFSSQEFDGATWFRWLPIEERDVLHAEPPLRQSVQWAANCSFGDAGTMYVFICRECPDWPTTAGMQCS
ncbi:MAG: hypothetical protein NT069_15715 [Planctomycetota bacterium]|nr:hypothetical protein [Planctomycetota bacterium]